MQTGNNHTCDLEENNNNFLCEPVSFFRRVSFIKVLHFRHKQHKYYKLPNSMSVMQSSRIYKEYEGEGYRI